MTSILNFELEIYSEELYTVTESEHDEVMRLMAEDENGFQDYSDWSQELDNQAWQGSEVFKGILIKKACEHRNCSHTRCAKAVRIGGIEI